MEKDIFFVLKGNSDCPWLLIDVDSDEIKWMEMFGMDISDFFVYINVKMFFRILGKFKLGKMKFYKHFIFKWMLRYVEVSFSFAFKWCPNIYIVLSIQLRVLSTDFSLPLKMDVHYEQTFVHFLRQNPTNF